MILPCDELITDLESAFEKIINFTGINVNESIMANVKKNAADQKNYKRKHKVMDLEQFGITREMITKDFDFVFKEYGIDPNL